MSMGAGRVPALCVSHCDCEWTIAVQAFST
jgi:hypothetical protein